jgi:hypothetical protein
VLRFTRVLFIAGVCLTAGTGIGLYAVPDRTPDYWAWTIKAPLSAAFFAAGYIGAAMSFALAARTHEWRQARTVLLAALTLTSLTLLATLRHLDTFALGNGGLPEAVAWTWLVVYVALPPLTLFAFVLQERAGGRWEYGAEPKALRATRVVFGASGLALGVLGVGLVAESSAFAHRWPWPLPPLPAAVLGGWLCTYAVAFTWFAFRERNWTSVRIGVLPAIVSFALDLVAVARFRGDLPADATTAVYVACLAGLLGALAATSFVEERRLRGTEHASSNTKLPGLDSNQQPSG